jgi:hypothetical protein
MVESRCDNFGFALPSAGYDHKSVFWFRLGDATLKMIELECSRTQIYL